MYFCKATTDKFLASHQSRLTVWKVVSDNKVDPMTGKTMKGGWNKGRSPVFLNRCYARKFKNHEEKVIRCEALARDFLGITRTKDEAVVNKLFVPKNSLIGKSE